MVSRGDVIWEPNDDFYRLRPEDCKYLNRSFTANGPDGSITVQKDPESGKKVTTIENGNSFYVSFTFTDARGRDWGVVQLEDGKSGWVLMEELVVVYDNISFCEDHKDEFKEYNGEFNPSEIDGKVLFRSYPGSASITSKVQASDIRAEDFSFSYTYTDSEKRLWGYVPYYMGSRGWICLSDPTNEAIHAVKRVTPVISAVKDESRTISDRVADENNSRVLFLIAGLVAVLVAATTILIRVFWKR